MPNLTQKKISEAKARLRRADSPTRVLFDASQSLAQIITACGYMIQIIQSQEDRLSRLENAILSAKEKS